MSLQKNVNTFNTYNVCVLCESAFLSLYELYYVTFFFFFTHVLLCFLLKFYVLYMTPDLHIAGERK